MHFSYFKLVKKLSFPWKGEAFFSPPYNEGYLINCYTKHITNCIAIFIIFTISWGEKNTSTLALQLICLLIKKKKQKKRQRLLVQHSSSSADKSHVQKHGFEQDWPTFITSRCHFSWTQFGNGTVRWSVCWGSLCSKSELEKIYRFLKCSRHCPEAHSAQRDVWKSAPGYIIGEIAAKQRIPLYVVVG